MEQRVVVSRRFVLIGLSSLAVACVGEGSSVVLGPATGPSTATKVGVLLVNHGSRSEMWRAGLLDLDERVRSRILEGGVVDDVRTAFMEYTEPSIATRLKELDEAGCTDVVVVPVFLTVSEHSFDDIPAIIGAKEDPKSIQILKSEGIERYRPRARTHQTGTLDFTDVVKENVLRRARALSVRPEEEGLVLIAYGDKTYDAEWASLLDAVSTHVRAHTGMIAHSRGYCGHVAEYSPEPTAAAIREVLKVAKRAVVVPVLVARDEMFQVQIIGDGIKLVADADTRVVYRADAILPDARIDDWVVQVSRDAAARLRGEAESG